MASNGSKSSRLGHAAARIRSVLLTIGLSGDAWCLRPVKDAYDPLGAVDFHHVAAADGRRRPTEADNVGDPILPADDGGVGERSPSITEAGGHLGERRGPVG